jgi:hypothetical protein
MTGPIDGTGHPTKATSWALLPVLLASSRAPLGQSLHANAAGHVSNRDPQHFRVTVPAAALPEAFWCT